MSIDPTQRIALITGASHGIGFETARQLARRGFHILLAARDESKGQQASEKLRAADGNSTFLLLDVSSSDSIRTAVGRFARVADHLDALINNAGIFPDEGVSILTIPRAKMVHTLQTNTFGPLEVTQAFVPYTCGKRPPRA